MDQLEAVNRIAGDIFGQKLPDGFECFVEARSVLDGAMVDVGNYRWHTPQEALLETSRFFLDLSLPTNATDARGRFVSMGHMNDQPHGQLFAVPPHHPLYSHWKPGRKRSVCCLLDLDRLTGCGTPSWNEDRLDIALDLKSLFIREAMIRLARETLSPGLAGAVMIESICRMLAVEVQRLFGIAPWPEDAVGGSLSAAELRRARERILRPGLPPPTVAELADECGMSTRNYERRFRKATGQSVAAFICSSRLSLAQSALTNPRSSIKQVAHLAGFKSISAFSAAFKREVGMTPRAFRGLVAGRA